MIPKIENEQLLANFLVLLIGKLTGWNAPIGGGGDPVFLTADESAAFAAEGISLLASRLPKEAAEKVSAAIERLPRPKHQGTAEDRLVSVGGLGGTIPSTGSHGGNLGGPPGCCVHINGRLVCVR